MSWFFVCNPHLIALESTALHRSSDFALLHSCKALVVLMVHSNALAIVALRVIGLEANRSYSFEQLYHSKGKQENQETKHICDRIGLHR
jgi:hypothetical protein